MSPLGIYARGLAMGAADAVPGVSGGTLAFITGIYELLLASLRALRPATFRQAYHQGWSYLWVAVNGRFLVTLFAGILTSLLALAHVVTWLLETHPLLLNGFFFGLILGSILLVSRRVQGWNVRALLFAILGMVLASSLADLLPHISEPSPLIFLLAGSIAICAMLLPGVSGSFLLLVMGMYAHVMEAVKTFDALAVVSFVSGCLLGMLSFSHLLGWLFQHHRQATLALMLGFIIGSLPQIWPWKHLLQYQLTASGKVVPLIQRNILPWDYAQITGEASALMAVSVLMAAGLCMVLILEHVSQPKKR